jgi:polysaccharide biosynthesis transport protein
LQNEYQHVQDRLQSANLAETFESQQGGERFTLVRAPSVPRLPVYPNRIGLIALGLLLGGALAGIAVAAAESMDRSVRMARDLALPEGIALLASIPIITNSADRRLRALRIGSFVTAYSLALLVVIAVIISAQHR